MTSRGWGFVDRFVCDETGATMVEYTILIAMLSLIALSFILSVGKWVKNAWTNTNTLLQNYRVAT
jgi:Flp pilus assembly pilin Flp